MKALLAVTALVAAAPQGPSPMRTASAAKSPQPPSAAQIRAAVQRARRSHNLWATINICNTKRYPDVVGIRGQMPALGFETSLSIDIQVYYWNASDKKFEPDPGVTRHVPLGHATTGFHQGGVSYRFAPPANLSAQVSFTWKLRGKVIGRASRLTAHGLKRVDFGDPPGYSAATCQINS